MLTERAPNIDRPTKSGNPATYHTLDAWRAIAAILVVLYHGTEGAIKKNPELLNQPFFWVSSFGSLGVQLFFVISGYCIIAAIGSSLHKEESSVVFFRKRIQRIYPPYLASLVLFYVLGRIFEWGAVTHRLPERVTDLPLVHLVQNAGGVGFWLGNISLTQLLVGTGFFITLSWTLCYEVAFYCIAGVILSAFRRHGMDYIIGIVHAVTVCCALGLLVWGRSVPYPFDLWPWFGAGAAIYDRLVLGGVHAKPIVRFRGVIVLIITGLLLFCALVTKRLVTISIWDLNPVPAVIVSALFVLILLGLKPWDQRMANQLWLRPLLFVGTFSYSVYLTHPICVWLARAAFVIVGLGAASEVLKACVIVLTALLLAYGFHLIAEKPWLRIKAIPVSIPDPATTVA